MFIVTVNYINGKREVHKAEAIANVECDVIVIETKTGFRRVHRSEESVKNIEIAFDNGQSIC